MHVLEDVVYEHGVGDVQGRHGASSGPRATGEEAVDNIRTESPLAKKGAGLGVK